MQAHELKRTHALKKKKRVGRGGRRGKTSGRGHKGQGQHGSHGVRVDFRDQIKKIPKLRGRGKNSLKSRKPKPIVFNCSFINEHFEDGDTVSPLTLKEKGYLKGAEARKAPVKILGNGSLAKKLTIEACLVSESARQKILAAGGTIIE